MTKAENAATLATIRHNEAVANGTKLEAAYTGAITANTAALGKQAGAAALGAKALTGFKNAGSSILALLGGPYGAALIAGGLAYLAISEHAKRATEELDNFDEAIRLGTRGLQALTQQEFKIKVTIQEANIKSGQAALRRLTDQQRALQEEQGGAEHPV